MIWTKSFVSLAALAFLCVGHQKPEDGPIHPTESQCTGEPIVRRVEVFAANATTGTYWPCGTETAVNKGLVCVRAERNDDEAIHRLRARIFRHRRWVRVEGSTLSPDDGRCPRPVDVLSPTWLDDGLSGWSLIASYQLQKAPLVTTHSQECRYVAAPFSFAPPAYDERAGVLCSEVENHDAVAWWKFWHQPPGPCPRQGA